MNGSMYVSLQIQCAPTTPALSRYIAAHGGISSDQGQGFLYTIQSRSVALRCVAAGVENVISIMSIMDIWSGKGRQRKTRRGKNLNVVSIMCARPSEASRQDKTRQKKNLRTVCWINSPLYYNHATPMQLPRIHRPGIELEPSCRRRGLFIFPNAGNNSSSLRRTEYNYWKIDTV
jgi:hypothetical protein